MIRRRSRTWSRPTACTATSISTRSSSSSRWSGSGRARGSTPATRARSGTRAITSRSMSAGQRLIVLRQGDRSVRVLVNRCAHKGTKLVGEPAGNCGKTLRCPYHAWTYRLDGSILNIPLAQGYDGTRLAETEAGRGLAAVENVATYRGFIFVRLSPQGLGFRDYFGASLSSIDNLADRSPEGGLEIAGGRLRYAHNCNWKMFVENLNDTMHPMIAHASSAGTARRLWEGKQIG